MTEKYFIFEGSVGRKFFFKGDVSQLATLEASLEIDIDCFIDESKRIMFGNGGGVINGGDVQISIKICYQVIYCLM